MRRRLVSIWVGLVMVTAACGGGGGSAGGDASSTTRVTTSTSTTVAPSSTTSTSSSTTTSSSSSTSTSTTVAAPATTVAPAPTFTDPIEFFRSTERACADHAARVGGAAPEPERFSGARVVEMVAFRVWLVEDGLGEQLVVDLEGEVVYSVDGPESPLPIMYSFGCPETLYLGTHWD